jgi:hypothetical protein
VALTIIKKNLELDLGAPMFDGAALDAWAMETLTGQIVNGEQGFDFVDYDVTLKDPTSRYKVASAMQKCIRRGMTEKAVFYAQAIFNSSDREYLWTRLPTIALEDVGPGNWRACALTMHFCRWAAVRKSTNQLRAVSWLVHELTREAKSRALCEAVCCAYFVFDREDPQTNRIGDTMAKLGWKAEDKSNPWFETEIVRDRAAVDAEMALVTTDKEILYTYHCGNKKSCAFLNAAMPLVLEMEYSEPLVTNSYALKDPVYIAGVPDWALDKHTRDGLRANKIFMSTNDVFPAWVSIPMFHRILFQAETALVDLEATNTQLTALRLHAEDIEAKSVFLTPSRHAELRAIMETDQFRKELIDARIKACS